MSQIASIFRKFIPQLLHVIVLPVFFFTFILILRPSISVMLLGNEWFGVHLTIMSCIILVSVILTRLFYYLVPMYLNYTIYSFWCLLEIIFMSFFLSLYLWLVMDKSMFYFEFLGYDRSIASGYSSCIPVRRRIHQYDHSLFRCPYGCAFCGKDTI